MTWSSASSEQRTWPVTVTEPLHWMIQRLNDKQPFCYIRFNDGEFYSMFGLKRSPEGNGEQEYTDALRRDLWRAWIGACCGSVEDNRVRVGSWWYEDPSHLAANAAAKFLRDSELYHEVKWARGHIWHREELEVRQLCLGPDLLQLLDLLRARCYLVGPVWMAPVANALQAVMVDVPEHNAHSHDISIPWRFPSHSNVLWCAGPAAKLWAWEAWQENVDVNIIDAGSLFDGLCGKVSRNWLKPGSGAHANFYYTTLKDHLKL